MDSMDEATLRFLTESIRYALENVDKKENGIRMGFGVEPNRTLIIDVYYKPVAYEELVRTNGLLPGEHRT